MKKRVQGHPTADPKKILLKLNKNLQILQERKAKYGGDEPIALLNQIDDHKAAIELTQMAIAGDLSEDTWGKELKPLLVDINARTGEATVTHIETGGGAYTEGDVNVSAGDFVGHDKHVHIHPLPSLPTVDAETLIEAEQLLATLPTDTIPLAHRPLIRQGSNGVPVGRKLQWGAC